MTVRVTVSTGNRAETHYQLPLDHMQQQRLLLELKAPKWKEWTFTDGSRRIATQAVKTNAPRIKLHHKSLPTLIVAS
jgi:hypothetical protein